MEGGRFKRKHPGLALGNLKCYWSSIVYSYEDHARVLKRNIWVLVLLGIFLFIFPMVVSFLIVGAEYSFSIWGVVAGLPLSLLMSGVLIGMSIYMYRKHMNRENPNEVLSAWRPVGEKRAYGSVRAFMENYGHSFKVKKNSAVMEQGHKSPEDVYIFDNGVQVRAVYSFSMGQPKGWLMIRYPFDAFEFALMLQIAIDEYMFKRDILKKRGMF